MKYRYKINSGISKVKSYSKQIVVGVFGLSIPVALVISSGAGAVNTSIYNNIPSPQPGNVPSVGFEATVTVLMSSWGCQTGHWTSGDCLTTLGATFSVPITLNVYAVGAGNAPGSKLITSTQTFNIPFRPSASPSCTGGDAGKWNIKCLR